MKYFVLIIIAITMLFFACRKNDCVKGNPDFDDCIHNSAEVKFNDQDIIDYFFSAKEGSWWAFHTKVVDTFGYTIFDCYDTLRLRHYNHSLDGVEDYTREMYNIFYYFNDKGWDCSQNKETAWYITATAHRDNLYAFDGSISGQGRGLGSIYKYNGSYYTGYLDYGWDEDEIYEYQKLDELTVNGIVYTNVWSNYLPERTLIDYGDFVCYFAKNIGIVKMINFHGNDAWETILIDYEIKS